MPSKPARLVWLAGVLVLLSGGLAAWAWPILSQTALERAESAYRRGDWSAAAARAKRAYQGKPANAQALALLARAHARLGRDAEALASYQQLPNESLTAEDLALLGAVFARAGRTALGATALDAALDLEPGFPAALEAQARLTSAQQPAAESAELAEQLGAVPEPRVRVGLLLALVRAESPRAKGRSPLLARVLARDRAALQAVHTPADVTKLLARLLLETGRKTEARKWLEPLSADSHDTEAQWLLSRAYLQLDQVAQAATALQRAGDFGGEHTAAPEPAEYVGSTRCAKCHGALCRSYGHSRHTQTLARAPKLGDVAAPAQPLPDPRNSSVTYRIERSETDVRVQAASGNEVVSALAVYLFGSGHHGTTLLLRDAQGKTRKMRMSYYAENRSWHFTDRDPRQPETLTGYLGDALGAEGLGQCLNCHTTVGTSVRDQTGPEAADQAIGCERCHGPGGNHLKAVAADFPEYAIAEPGMAAPAERLAICAQCHRSDGTAGPDDPGFVRFKAPNLVQSRCYTASGQLDCITCHAPHRALETSAASYEAKCLACHAQAPARSAAKDDIAAASHEAPQPCRVNPSSGCIGCHMPKVYDEPQHSSFTDHFIRIHPESRPAK